MALWEDVLSGKLGDELDDVSPDYGTDQELAEAKLAEVQRICSRESKLTAGTRERRTGVRVCSLSGQM